MKTKVWMATVAFGCLAALSGGVSADLIPAVDAWGRGTGRQQRNKTKKRTTMVRMAALISSK